MEQTPREPEQSIDDLRKLASALVRQLSEEDCRQILALISNRP